MPESLQATCSSPANSCIRAAHSSISPVAIVGLGDVVDHEPQVREVAHRGDRRGQFAGPHQQVVDKAMLGHRFEVGLHRFLEQPVGIVFVVDLVPDPDEVVRHVRWIAGREEVTGLLVGQVDPADDSGHEVVFPGDLQELAGFLDIADGLHKHGGVDAVGLEQRPDVFRAVGPLSDSGIQG